MGPNGIPEENSPTSQASYVRRGRIRLLGAASSLARCGGRSLSDPAGASAGRLRARRLHRHHGAAHRPHELVAAARPAIPGREPGGRQQQHRGRGRWRARRRTATRCSRSGTPNAHNATLYDKLSFDFLPATSRRWRASTARRSRRWWGRRLPSEDGCRVHRLRQGPRRQDQHGVIRRRRAALGSVRRAVQDDDRDRDGRGAISGRRGGVARPAERAGRRDLHPGRHRRWGRSAWASLRALGVTSSTRRAGAAVRRSRTIGEIRFRATTAVSWTGIGRAGRGRRLEIVATAQCSTSTQPSRTRRSLAQLAKLGLEAVLASSPAEFSQSSSPPRPRSGARSSAMRASRRETSAASCPQPPEASTSFLPRRKDVDGRTTSRPAITNAHRI